LDISINKCAKSFLSQQFQSWYADQVNQQYTTPNNTEIEPVDLSASRMKCVGAQRLIRLYEHISQSPTIIINGFHEADIPQSIETGKPVYAIFNIDSN
jgi:hypothetical protein